jgi:signal transduction histidine kinase
MLLAGAYSFSVLRQMQSEEELARQNFLHRSQSLGGMCSSLETYSDHVQTFILRDAPGDPADVDRLATAIEDAVRQYPATRDADERDLLAAIQDAIDRERGLLGALLSLAPGARRAVAPRVVVEELLPLRAGILDCSARVRLWSGRELAATSRVVLERFSALEGSLTRLLLVALGSGLLLGIGSILYIGRLESDAQRRYEELARSRGELQRLSARLLDAQEAERRSISRELHDEVGQSLGALLMDLGRVSAHAPEPLKEELAHMKSVAESTVQTVRNIALLLRPSMLDDLGLIPALEWQAREVSRRTGMEADVHSEGVPEDLPEEDSVCIYRLVQEALNNAARHSGARTAHVSVEVSAGRIGVTVRDDGGGFDPQRTRGLGILGMEERVKRLAGTFAIETQPGAGTAVRASLPLRGDDRV